VATAAALITRFGLVAGMQYLTLLWLLAIALAIGVALFGISRKVQ
jgi:hypothetical protein